MPLLGFLQKVAGWKGFAESADNESPSLRFFGKRSPDYKVMLDAERCDGVAAQGPDNSCGPSRNRLDPHFAIEKS